MHAVTVSVCSVCLAWISFHLIFTQAATASVCSRLKLTSYLHTRPWHQSVLAGIYLLFIIAGIIQSVTVSICSRSMVFSDLGDIRGLAVDPVQRLFSSVTKCLAIPSPAARPNQTGVPSYTILSPMRIQPFAQHSQSSYSDRPSHLRHSCR